MAKNRLFVAIIALAVLAGCGGGSKPTSSTTAPTANPPATNSPTSTPVTGQAIQVTLDSPRIGGASNPLTIKATATGADGFSGWIVYVDDNVADRADNHQNTLSTSVTLDAGSHKVYVRAWDQTSVNFGTSTTLQVDVNGAQAMVSPAAPTSTKTAPPATSASAPAVAPVPAPPPPPPAPKGPLPEVPGNAKIWDGIQKSDGWESCSSCAGGQSSTGDYWTAGWRESPSMSGNSREFFLGGPAWDAALWIKKLGQNNWASHFLWDFWVRFDDTSAANVWTAEYDLWQSINGQEFMIGTHCNFGENHWDIWDSKNWRWAPTDIPCPRFAPNDWHHIQWYFERWGSYQYHYGIMIVDGKVFNLDRTFGSNGTDWSDGLGVQWQLDKNGSDAPLHEWVDNVKLSIW